MTKSPASEASHSDDDEQQDNPQNTTKTPAVKDKECQYCHQKFTSSSLGRHLDQFISKKKPDGVHDVDEIRRMRGGITRRTARSNKDSKKELDESHSTQNTPSPQYTLPSYSELVTKTATAQPDVRMAFNRMNWQATGVITDPASLNPPSAAVASPSIANPTGVAATGTKRSYSTYASDLPTTPAPAIAENVRALELSLREVLDTVRVATKKAEPAQQPFTFEFTAQTFPCLCLKLLPMPDTLFTTAPFATSSSIPLSAPDIEQYHAVRKAVDYFIDQWKWTRLSYVQRTAASPNLAEEMEDINDAASGFLQSAAQHLDAAYQNFISFSPESRQSLWMIELMRALKKEQNDMKDTNSKIKRLTQETAQLQQQIDHLSKCQWPREMALWPPERVILSESAKEELGRINLVKGEQNGPMDGSYDGNTDEQNRNVVDRWDYDLLVNKWKRHVKEDRSRRVGGQPAPQFSSGMVPPPLENHMSAHSEHSAASTPWMPSGLGKSTLPDYRPGTTGPNPETGSVQNSPVVNGSSNGVNNGLMGYDSRRRNVQVISDVDDIFLPRLKGLRADNVIKSSATP